MKTQFETWLYELEEVVSTWSGKYPQLNSMNEEEVFDFATETTFECWDGTKLALVCYEDYCDYCEDQRSIARDVFFDFAYNHLSKEPAFIPSEQDWEFMKKECRLSIIQDCEEVDEKNADEWMASCQEFIMDNCDWEDRYFEFVEEAE